MRQRGSQRRRKTQRSTTSRAFCGKPVSPLTGCVYAKIGYAFLHPMRAGGEMRNLAAWRRVGVCGAGWIVLLSVAASIAAFPVPAPTDVTGFWVFRVPTGDGNYRESFLDLKQSGEKISGKTV